LNLKVVGRHNKICVYVNHDLMGKGAIMVEGEAMVNGGERWSLMIVGYEIDKRALEFQDSLMFFRKVKGFCVFDEKSGSFLCMDRLVVRERG